jgi:YVTN family beta-propeller protein
MMHTKGRTASRAWLLIGALAVAAPAGAQTRAYVASTNANQVVAIDAATGDATPIAVGIAPAQIALSQDGARAFVINRGSNSVSVIDTQSDAVIDTIVLADRPTSVAVTPDGERVYVMGVSGVVEVFGTSTKERLASLFVGGSSGRLAIAPAGDRVYVASGSVSIIDTASNELVGTFAPEAFALPGVTNIALDVATSVDGSVYVSVMSQYFDATGFSVSGGVAVIDAGMDRVTRHIELYSVPGSLAVAADGLSVHVGIQAFWADTGYGAGFLPGQWVASIDVAEWAVSWTDTGGASSPAGVSASQDGAIVFAALPAIDAIAEIDVATNTVTRFHPVGGAPIEVAVLRAVANPRPPALVAGDDNPAPVLAPAAAAIIVASVLANDTIGGAPASLATVALSLVSSASGALALDPGTGAVAIAAGVQAGTHTLVYQICDRGRADNCAIATVAVLVRHRLTLAAQADEAASHPGVRAIDNVLGNDTVDGAPALLQNVTLAVVSSDPGLSLNTAEGSVFVAAGTSAGLRSLTYRVCDIASGENCVDADVRVTVVPRTIAAANDSGTTVTVGGTAVANVLANDALQGAAATLSRVTLATVSSTDSRVTLTAAGAVVVAGGGTAGVKTLVYRICDALDAGNCADATVTVTVGGSNIKAAGEIARASSITSSTPVKDVLANDTIGGVRATLSNVTLRFVSISPSNSRIKLTASGSVSVGTRAGPGNYNLVYEVCEIGNPANCARATVRLELKPRN